MRANETSVSGISSGGYMAVQFHVSFSATLRGAGITAGGRVTTPQSPVSDGVRLASYRSLLLCKWFTVRSYQLLYDHS